MNRKILKEIYQSIEYVWKYDIKKDYDNDMFCREDTLKNAMYFHLRTRLSSLLEQYNIRIYTEFALDKFKKSNCRPDMVVVSLDEDGEIYEYLCVIELKYKGDFTKAADLVYQDYDKLRYYIEELDLECPKYYMASIWETRTDSKRWLIDDMWAKELVTELNADVGSRGDMLFYVKKH